jgi:hypothetical protein
MKDKGKSIDSSLFDRLKSAKPAASPAAAPVIQKVAPPKEEKEVEHKYPLWINLGLFQELEGIKTKERVSIKDLLTEGAIEVLRKRGISWPPEK